MNLRVLLTSTLLTLCAVLTAQEKHTVRLGGAMHHALPPQASGPRGTAPANDACANAETITVSSDCASPVAGNNADATDTPLDVPCDDPGSVLLDVWYIFNSGAHTSVYITLTPGTGMTDYNFVVYDACGGNVVHCITTASSAQTVAVTANTDYRVRVYSNVNYGVGGPFTLCVSTSVVVDPAPANDLCTAVTPQTLAIGSSVSHQGNNTGATDSEGLGFNSAWEAFTISACADVKIDFCGTAMGVEDFWLMLYTSCPATDGIIAGSYNNTTCTDGNFTLCYPHLPAGTYYYPVAATPNNTGAYTLTVSAQTCGTEQASNDDCAGAIALTANATCNPQYFTNACATQSLPAAVCNGTSGVANDDVWYSFTATATEMSVGGAPHGNMDIVMQLFGGNCGSLTPLVCSDFNGQGTADDLIATGLTVNDTYYLRVYDFRAQYSYAAPGYELCVVEGLGSGMGVEELNASNGIALFPNPSTGLFSVRVKRGSTATITVMDTAGRTVLLSTERVVAGAVQVDATALKPGTYVVRFTDGERILCERLVIP